MASVNHTCKHVSVITGKGVEADEEAEHDANQEDSKHGDKDQDCLSCS